MHRRQNKTILKMIVISRNDLIEQVVQQLLICQDLVELLHGIVQTLVQ